MTTFERLHGIFPNTPAATEQLFLLLRKVFKKFKPFINLNFRLWIEILKFGLITSLGECAHWKRDFCSVEGKKKENIFFYLYARDSKNK